MKELPTELPYDEHETDKLEQRIKDRYASSTFNICEHQALPLMTGEPIRLFVDEKVKPHAVNTPATIPIHFREEVKAQLDRDVRLGVCHCKHTSHLVFKNGDRNEAGWISQKNG